MNSRQSVLKRLKLVYELVEDLHSLELRRASALVGEAEKAITEQCVLAQAARHDARRALAEGDREQWVIAEAQRAVSGDRGLQLDVVRRERELVTDLARQEYRASRLRSEQMKSVVKRNEAAEALLAGRRSQALADDRFLSRLRWDLLQVDGV